MYTKTAALILFLLVLQLQLRSQQQKSYFQQEVNFEINVTLDDRKHELNAFESIEYKNNSPDTLRIIYFHLWPNAYSNNNTCLARQLFRLHGNQKLFNDKEKAGYIDSLDFRVNSREVKMDFFDGMPDVCILHLNEPLLPGGKILINTPFHIKIPDGQVSRFGHTDWSYQVSQWYPKPAVYDRYGWHPMPYLDQGEFYSEFGFFHVFINIPEDYTVGASGNLVTESEITRLNRLSDDSTRLFRRSSPYRGPSAQKMKTLEYRSEKIHDFAWFADRDFNVLADNVQLPGGKTIKIYSMFTPSQVWLWINSTRYIHNAILKFSEWIGNYPYDSFTAVQGALAAGSGMEYPGLTVIGYTGDPYILDQVIAHEIAHNWFYGSLGSNERDYPFIDEGITSAYESRYLDYYYPGMKMWEVYFSNPKLAKLFNIDKLPVSRMEELEWLVSARNNLEQPANLPAYEYSETNYSNIIYFKTGKGFNLLRNYLGDQVFDSIMHAYYAEWGNRHPYPEDIRKYFASASVKNFDWFFDDYLKTVKTVDYSIRKLEGDSMLVVNKGLIPAPFPVTGFSPEGKSLYGFWSDGFMGRKWIKLPGLAATIRINDQHIVPETYYLNNNVKSSGLLRRWDRINPTLLFSVEDPDRVTMMVAPLLNWNRQDGLMAGIAVNNGIMLVKPVEYSIMPFFRFRDAGLSGKGKLAINFFPYDIFIRKASLSFDGMKFGRMDQSYRMLRSGLDLYFRPDFRNQIFSRVYGRFIAASDLTALLYNINPGVNYFFQAGYTVERISPFNPCDVSLGFESGDSYSKVSLTVNYKIGYGRIKNGLETRLYAGTMLKENRFVPFYSIAPSGRSGRELYTYQGEFADRFSAFPENFWSRQMAISEGGLITPLNSYTGYSSWLISAGFASTLPGAAGQIPVKPFVNVLYNDKPSGGSHFYYEAGIKAGISGFFEIYLPFIVSRNINSVRDNIKERIRFTLSLDSFLRLRLNSGQPD
ncbi:MAG TPA: M1 family metallopeptidase [Bacteroidales bacterium]|nr:M1 family metallopeptidase [Bacteroidales bacterium]